MDISSTKKPSQNRKQDSVSKLTIPIALLKLG